MKETDQKQERDVPMPVRRGHFYEDTRCPVCNAFCLNHWNYCCRCGQRISFAFEER